MPVLASERCIVDPRPAHPLQVLASRYYLKDEPQPSPNEGYTLIFLHATGMHKETWEVTIQRLLERQKESGHVKISDVYSIECPNHGESAVLNDQALRESPYTNHFPPREYSLAVHIFLTAGPDKGARVDFSKRRLIGIGHSVGAPALFLMMDLQPRVNFSSFIVVEPGISLKNHPETDKASSSMTAWTWLRRDTWTSRKSARKELERNPLYAMWDPRVLDLYIKYGLRTHPAAIFKPPFDFRGVCTALSREQEAASYRSDQLVVDGLEAYGKLTQELPIHVIWGTYNDIATPALQDLLSDKSTGRTPASVRSLEDAGHLAVQQQPEAVGDVIYDIIAQSPSRTEQRSKL